MKINIDSKVMNAIQDRPITMIDVGAAGGIQPIWRDRGFERYCQYFGFEANPDNYAKLPNESKTVFFQMAISDSIGQMPFYKFSTVSSLVPRTDRSASFNEKYETIDVKVETLENLRSNGTLPGLDIIKTDVERHDYFAVKGAGIYLKNETLCVVSEFEYYGAHEGSRFRDIDNLLTTNGMLLFGLQHKTGALGEISGGDLLYLKDIGHIISLDIGIEKKREQALKLYLICFVLSQYQYAFSIAKIGKEHGFWGEEESDVLSNYVLEFEFLPYAVPWVSGGLKIANFFALIAQIFSGSKWAGKAAPRLAALRPFGQLTVRRSFLPSSWSRRYAERCNAWYERYQRLRKSGMFYK